MFIGQKVRIKASTPVKAALVPFQHEVGEITELFIDAQNPIGLIRYKVLFG